MNDQKEDLKNLHDAQSLSLDFWDNEIDDIWNEWTGEKEARSIKG